MIRQFKTTPDQCSIRRRRNGYSMAKILLMFSIAASVLIFVWTMYAALSDVSDDIQTAIAEIQMIKHAGHTFSSGQDHAYTDIGTNLNKLKPYLQPNGLSNGRNVFGAPVTLATANADRDLDVTYPGVHNVDICQVILGHFGEVSKSSVTYMGGDGEAVSPEDKLHIDFGKTMEGYIGGTGVTGCKKAAHGDYYELHIRID